MRKYAAAMISFVGVLSGCASTPPPALDISLIGKAVSQIKRQVGIYQSIVQADPNRHSPLPPKADWDVCGPGVIDFDITAVKAELTTKIETNQSGTGGVTAPIAAVPGATAGIGGGLGRDSTNSQVLSFNMYPILPQKFSTDVTADGLRDPENAVAATLLAFRGALREASHEKPCFSTVHDPEKDKPDTLVVGVDAVADKNFNVTLKLIFVNLGGMDDQKTTAGSKITFAFQPWPPVAKPEKADAAVKKPGPSAKFAGKPKVPEIKIPPAGLNDPNYTVGGEYHGRDSDSLFKNVPPPVTTPQPAPPGAPKI